MLKSLSEESRIRILAVILAALAWVYVRAFSGSIGSQRAEMHLTVPITIVDLRYGERAHSDPETVGIVGELALQSDTSVRAIVDAGGRRPGTYHLPVRVEASGNVYSLSPANVTLTISKESE